MKVPVATCVINLNEVGKKALSVTILKIATANKAPILNLPRLTPYEC